MSKSKADLIAAVADKARIQGGRAEELVNLVFECMTAALARGEGIEIRSFGSFSVRQYRAYEGRNPRSGVSVQVKPKRAPHFKVGKELRERVNASRPKTATAP